MEIVDAQDWYAPESAWKQRGAERFAETIVWGRWDQRRRPTLIDVSCRELHADFRSITGSTAPGPLEQICALEPVLALSASFVASAVEHVIPDARQAEAAALNRRPRSWCGHCPTQTARSAG